MDTHRRVGSSEAFPNLRVCASGQVGRSPKILVWDTGTLQTLADLSGFHARGVGTLSFSPNGAHLVSTGMDNDHSIAVYDWAKGTKLYHDKGHNDRMAEFSERMAEISAEREKYLNTAEGESLSTDDF